MNTMLTLRSVCSISIADRAEIRRVVNQKPNHRTWPASCLHIIRQFFGVGDRDRLSILLSVCIRYAPLGHAHKNINK